MADNVLVDNGTEADYTVSSDQAGDGSQVQRVKLAYSADGSSTHVPADVDGLLVNLGANNDVTVAGVATQATLAGVETDTGAILTELTSGIALPDGAATDASLASILTKLAAGLPSALATDRLKVDGSGVTQPVSGTVTVTDGSGSLTVDGTVTLGAGSASVGILGANSGVDIGDVTINNASGASAVNIQDGGNAITVDSTQLPAALVGGRLDVVVGAALPAGTAAIGKLAANSGVDIGDVDVTSLPTLANVTTVATLTTLTGGSIAHGTADGSTNPLKTGARAISSDITAEAANDRVDSLATILGKHLVMPYALPGRLVAGTLNRTDNTAANVIAGGGSGIRTYVTALLVTNAHASVSTKVSIRSATTVIWTGYAKAAGGGFSASFPSPLRGGDNEAITAICGTTGADVDINISGYQGAE